MYLLDTNICIYLIKKHFPCLQERIEKEEISSLFVSAITVAELEYGIAKSIFPQKKRGNLFKFLLPFDIVPFNEKDCEAFGLLRNLKESRN